MFPFFIMGLIRYIKNENAELHPAKEYWNHREIGK
jgi:hypothetical protein